MLGLNLLVRLGRRVLKGPVTDAGLLPGRVYRHLVLEALEAENFPEALHYLQWAGDPLLPQLVVLRLRLLRAKHAKQRQEVLNLPAPTERYQDLLQAEDLALRLLEEYEARALALLGRPRPPAKQAISTPF